MINLPTLLYTRCTLLFWSAHCLCATVVLRVLPQMLWDTTSDCLRKIWDAFGCNPDLTCLIWSWRLVLPRYQNVCFNTGTNINFNINFRDTHTQILLTVFIDLLETFRTNQNKKEKKKNHGDTFVF